MPPRKRPRIGGGFGQGGVGRQPTKSERKAVNKATKKAPKTDQGKGAKSDPNVKKGKKPKKPITQPPQMGAGFGFGSFGPGGFGGGQGPGTTPGAPDDREGPPGWIWDPELGWVEDPDFVEEEETEEEEGVEFDNDLMAYVSDLLEQYGLNTPGLLEFARNAIAQGWSSSQIMLELRRHPDYLANPLFAANVARAAAGGGWMAEGQLIAYANESKRLATQYGYTPPPDSFIALNIQNGRSLAEFEHRLQIKRNVDTWGGGVRIVMEELGFGMSDHDMFDLFDPEKDTQEWTQAFRTAQFRGRPAALGMGIRSDIEARAAEMLGIDPDEWFNRFSTVAQGASRFENIAGIEAMITGDLPEDFGGFVSRVPNNLLVRAEVFQDPQARAEIQAMYMREIARHKQGGGVAGAGALLSGAERATFG